MNDPPALFQTISKLKGKYEIHKFQLVSLWNLLNTLSISITALPSEEEQLIFVTDLEKLLTDLDPKLKYYVSNSLKKKAWKTLSFYKCRKATEITCILGRIFIQFGLLLDSIKPSVNRPPPFLQVHSLQEFLFFNCISKDLVNPANDSAQNDVLSDSDENAEEWCEELKNVFENLDKSNQISLKVQKKNLRRLKKLKSMILDENTQLKDLKTYHKNLAEKVAELLSKQVDEEALLSNEDLDDQTASFLETSTSLSTFSSQPPISTLNSFSNHRKVNKYFIQRKIPLEENLEETDQSVLIYGKGGVGKTVAIVQFVQQFKPTHLIYWLECDSLQSFMTSIGDLYFKIKEEFHPEWTGLVFSEKIRKLFKFLKGSNTNYILVYDNFNNPFPDQKLSAIFPKHSANGQCIVSTRNKSFFSSSPDFKDFFTKMVEIPKKFEIEEAKTLFETILGNNSKYPSFDSKITDLVVNQLLSHPLSVNMCFQALNSNHTIDEFFSMSEIVKKQADFQVVHIPFLIELQSILSDVKSLQLLYLLSFLGPCQHTKSIFIEILPKIDESYQLQKLNPFLTYSKESFSLHTLLIESIQHYVKKILDQSAVEGLSFQSSIVSQISDTLPTNIMKLFVLSGTNLTEEFIYIIQNHFSILKSFNDSFIDNFLNRFAVLDSSFFHSVLVDIVPKFINNIPFNNQNVETLFSLFHHLIKSLKFNLEFDEALKICSTFLKKSQLLDAEVERSCAYSDLGSLCFMLQKYDLALENFHLSLYMRLQLYPESKFPTGISELAACYNNLGLTYHHLQKYDLALETYQLALKMQLKLYPEAQYPNGHTDLAKCYNNVGLVCSNIQKYDAALKNFILALEIEHKLFPETEYPNGHSCLAISYNNIGSVYKNLEKYDLALKNYNLSFNMKLKLYPQSLYPNGHSELADSYHIIANLHSLIRQSSKTSETKTTV